MLVYYILPAFWQEILKFAIYGQVNHVKPQVNKRSQDPVQLCFK